jgi:hypothetical protein
VALVGGAQHELDVLSERPHVIRRRHDLLEVRAAHVRRHHHQHPEGDEREQPNAERAVERRDGTRSAHQGEHPPQFVVEHDGIAREEQEEHVQRQHRVEHRGHPRELPVV